jgi:ribosomal protein S18 acetylase RimI-like enzyme
MDMDATLRVRPATAADYPTFVRLFPELGVDDPIMAETKFAREIVPTSFIAERDAQGSRVAVGYAHFRIMKDVVYVRHLISAPDARRCGVGRLLMAQIADHARSQGCTTWCLSVKIDNAPAIALYESIGFSRAFESCMLRLDWAVVDAQPATPDDDRARARAIAPEDDARVESAMRLLSGQLQVARSAAGRVLLMLEEHAEGALPEVVGVAAFDPLFPGAFPFAVARPALALVLLRALRPYARPDDTFIGLVVEDQPALVDWLLAAGAVVRLKTFHMKGSLHPAR